MLKHLLFFLTFTSTFVGISQSVELNPFSSYGLGNQILPTDAIQASMGGSSVAFNDSTLVSYLNSASIASLTKGYPLFSLGVNGKRSEFAEGADSYTNGFASLDHLILAVPFKNRYGIALGLSPFARRGYEFESRSVVAEGDTSIFEYAGNGSMSKAFVGLSYKIINRKKISFSLGSNVGYVFGTTSNSRVSSLTSENSAIGVGLQTDRLQSLHYDFSFNFGYAFNDAINRERRIQINGFYDPSQRLTGTYTDELKFGFSPLNTLSVSSLITDVIYISASSLRIGANYAMAFKRTSRKNKEFTSELTFTGEYAMTTFTDFKKDFNAQAFSSFPSNHSRYSFGIQYTPNIGYQRSLTPTGFFNKLKYRAGTYAATLPYQHGSENFMEFGTTFGIGIPMVSSNAFSSVNFGVDFGKRTNGTTGALTENYLGFNIGIIIAPSKADKWFRKIKLD